MLSDDKNIINNKSEHEDILVRYTFYFANTTITKDVTVTKNILKNKTIQEYINDELSIINKYIINCKGYDEDFGREFEFVKTCVYDGLLIKINDLLAVDISLLNQYSINI